jgi:hypothetical protein
MIVRNNQGVFYNTLGSSSGGLASSTLTGRVFHVVMDENSIGFNNWSSIGDVYYVDPTAAPPTEITLDILKNYTPAKALFAYHSYIPSKDELILLFSLPSSDSPDIQNQKQIYYISSINLFNNTNHNSQGIYNLNSDGSINLGSSIKESTTVGNIFPFEGDHILYGRWGHGLRFSSTLNENNLENFWSITGKNGDPITLLVNGYNFTKDLNGRPYVENINNDKSSLYLTSTQAIPIDINNTTTNPLINPISPNKYFDSQAILNANRILINSNKDEILLYSKTNTIISSKDTIFLDSNRNILLNSQYIFLGISNNNKIPTEPILLGNKTINLLNDLLVSLKDFSSDLTSAMGMGKGELLLSITQPANSLETSVDRLMKQLESLKSKKVYTT